MLPLTDGGGVLREALAGAEEDASVTVLICQRIGARQDSGNEKTYRLGMVVRQVLDVATGELLDEDVHLCAERLVMVNERLTVMHEAFQGEAGSEAVEQTERWREVA